MKRDDPIRELGKISTRLRVEDLQHYDQEDWRQKTYDAHAKTQCIFLRHWKDKNINATELQDYPLIHVYGTLLHKILDELSLFYQFIDFAAIITNLRANSSIPKHTDNGKIFERAHRIHIPIKTNSDVVFHCGEMSINMKTDHAYEIANASHMHGVDNNSDEDRHHLIIDLFVNLATKH
jgi:hypothetical protein